MKTQFSKHGTVKWMAIITITIVVAVCFTTTVFDYMYSKVIFITTGLKVVKVKKGRLKGAYKPPKKARNQPQPIIYLAVLR